MKEQKKRGKVTIGLDLGDRRHRFCVLGYDGEVVEEGSLLNERVQLSGLVSRAVSGSFSSNGSGLS